MGFMDMLGFGGKEKEQEQPVAEMPQEAEMEIVQSTEAPAEGEYDSGVKFEDLKDKTAEESEAELEEQIKNAENPEMPPSVADDEADNWNKAA